jgi:asparagine synthase (glutamine-hydrolysing)
MSGIVGIVGPEAQQDTARTMLDAMRHRGPENTHIHVGDGFVVGCCEQELGARSTPAYAGEGGSALVLDGLVYNPRAAERSDVDTLWDLYQKHGAGFLQQVDGTFTLALVAGNDFLAARDHVGARSLFLDRRGETLFFATELKALKGLVDEPTELPAGHSFSIREGMQPFEPFEPEVPDCESPEQAKRVLRELLVQATRDQLADGAVGGSGLSGGLDSSVIVAIAYELGHRIPLFTIGLPGSEDLQNAALMAAHLGASEQHHVLTVTEERIAGLVREAVWQLESYEEDCISGCIANLLTSELAARHTNCCLSGEGSDELFGGYHLLKDVTDLTKRQAMMDKLVAIAYNTALRRLDRGWMANSVQYRTPFLDTRVIAFSRKIPVDWKIYGKAQIEKWIVREACRDLLPAEIADRRKLRFAAGAGVDDIMDRLAAEHISSAEFEAHQTTASGYELNSPKELWYYRIFKELFPKPGFEKQVARWDPYKS